MAVGGIATLAVAAAVEDRWAQWVSAVVAGAVVVAVAVVVQLVFPAHTGGGDTALVGALGVYLGWFGWSGLALGLLAATGLTGAVAVAVWVRRGRRAMFPAGPPLIIGTVVAVALLGLTACGSDSPSAPNDPDRTVPSTTTSVVVDERGRVVAAYDEFWERTHSVPHDPESTWDDEMAEVAVDPQLSITLQGMRLAKQRGSTSYGDVTPRVAAVDINGDKATVVDCQDASRSGQKDAKSGKKKTVGVERNPVKARMHRDDGQWKVAEISYPGGDC